MTVAELREEISIELEIKEGSKKWSPSIPALHTLYQTIRLH